MSTNIRQNRLYQKLLPRDKQRHILIKGPIHQEDITIINIYAPSIIFPNYMKQILLRLKREVNRSTDLQ